MEELLRSSLAVRGALVTDELSASPRGEALHASLRARNVELLHLGDRDFASAAGTESPQGVLAVAAVPVRNLHQLSLAEDVRILVLDGVQDPGNAGALLRTAAALGAHAALALPGTVDLWNAKVVRSAMGALFHRPAISCTWEELERFLHDQGVALWGAAPEGDPIDTLSAPRRLALVVGNEGGGLSDRTRSLVERTVSIPISSDVDSLNVAVAAGILLHHFRA